MDRVVITAAVLATGVAGVSALVAAGLAGCGGTCCGTGCDARSGAAGGAGAPLYAAAGAPAGSAVGTFDRTKVLVAYYGSERHRGAVAAMKRERDLAVARGDTARAAELERQGEAMQERAHRQLAGEEPLTNIGAALGDDLERIAAEAGVSMIVERGREPKGRTVDVTERLVERLASAK